MKEFIDHLVNVYLIKDREALTRAVTDVFLCHRSYKYWHDIYEGADQLD